MPAERRTLIITSVLVAMPLLWWLVGLALIAWTPQGDLGIQTVKVHDVFSGHLQLLGMPATTYHEIEGFYANHPGSLYLQFIAIPYALTSHSPIGLLIGGVIVIAGLILGALHAAYMVAGRVGVLTVAPAIILVELFLSARTITGWNPNVTLISLLAAIVFAWAVAEGKRHYLVAFVISTALAAQSHVAGVPLALVLILVVFVFLARQFRAGTRPSISFCVVTTIAVVVSWWAPVTDALSRDPGNVQSLIRWTAGSSGGETLDPTSRMLSYLVGVVLVIITISCWRRKDLDRWGSLFLLGAVYTSTFAVIAFLIPGRMGYFAFLLGPVLVIFGALYRHFLVSSQARSWLKIAAVAFVASVLFLPLLPADEQASSTLAAQVTQASDALLKAAPNPHNLPLVIDGSGAIAWASLASAVQASAVANVGPATLRNIVVDQDQAWRRTVLEGPRRELLVREVGAGNEAWTAPDGSRVIEISKVRPAVQTLEDLGTIRNPNTDAFELILLEFE